MCVSFEMRQGLVRREKTWLGLVGHDVVRSGGVRYGEVWKHCFSELGRVRQALVRQDAA